MSGLGALQLLTAAQQAAAGPASGDVHQGEGWGAGAGIQPHLN